MHFTLVQYQPLKCPLFKALCWNATSLSLCFLNFTQTSVSPSPDSLCIRVYGNYKNSFLIFIFVTMSYIKLLPDDEFHELIKAFASYFPEFKSKSCNVEVGSELNTL